MVFMVAIRKREHTEKSPHYNLLQLFFNEFSLGIVLPSLGWSAFDIYAFPPWGFPSDSCIPSFHWGALFLADNAHFRTGVYPM
jgi:hypothetical protein